MLGDWAIVHIRNKWLYASQFGKSSYQSLLTKKNSEYTKVSTEALLKFVI